MNESIKMSLKLKATKKKFSKISIIFWLCFEYSSKCFLKRVILFFYFNSHATAHNDIVILQPYYHRRQPFNLFFCYIYNLLHKIVLLLMEIVCIIWNRHYVRIIDVDCKRFSSVEKCCLLLRCDFRLDINENGGKLF